MGRTAGKYLMEMPHKPQENSHTMVWYTIIIEEMWSAPADSKLCFRLTKTGRFNGEYTDKPLLISNSSVAFYISNYNSFEITKQIEPNVVSLSVYFMSESLVCYVAKFVFIMKNPLTRTRYSGNLPSFPQRSSMLKVQKAFWLCQIRRLRVTDALFPGVGMVCRSYAYTRYLSSEDIYLYRQMNALHISVPYPIIRSRFVSVPVKWVFVYIQSEYLCLQGLSSLP